MARKLNPILQTELRKCYTQLLECIVREQGDKTQVSVAMLKKLYPLTMTGKTHPYAYIENEIGVDKSLISYFPEFDAKAWNFREFGQRMGERRVIPLDGWSKLFYQIKEGCEDDLWEELMTQDFEELDESGEITLKLSQQEGIGFYIQMDRSSRSDSHSYMIWKGVFVPQLGRDYICVINMNWGAQNAGKYWANIYHIDFRNCVNIYPRASKITSQMQESGWHSFFYFPITSLSSQLPFLNWDRRPWEELK